MIEGNSSQCEIPEQATQKIIIISWYSKNSIKKQVIKRNSSVNSQSYYLINSTPSPEVKFITMAQLSKYIY